MNLGCPRVILTGDQDSGKSTVISMITGISLGIPNLCPIEWHVQPSRVYQARVSVAYHYASQSSFTIKKHKVLKYICSTPAQLKRLVKQALVLARFPGNFATIVNMKQYELDDAIETFLATQSCATGVVYVHLKSPSCVRQLTIVDLPGLRRSGRVKTIKYIEDITRYYLQQKDVIISIVARGKVSEEKIYALSQVLGARGTMADTSLILTISDSVPLAKAWYPVLNGASRRRYPCLCVRIDMPNEIKPPFALNGVDIDIIRQEEASYFLFDHAWRSLHPTVPLALLGVTNVANHWEYKFNSTVLQNRRKGASPAAACWLLFLFALFMLYLSLIDSSED